ncbi:hypothetical protein TVAG_233080 [Trichomonas vaginalis G3]|uniref:Uncharacterized protein n=1 Tax=Trichomonas vaginalis (strain ATCC PRA-98 / G3) TaxID=412133 RepID=A2ERX7_TRIV3|nr:hypothetical protein TVAGG3_0486530 [Trichomonas vaginalis G3]EAY04572.1 hypothetical protein TVAG_233080 [Trichomonas vaginalis G3]KAI5516071.1 hypothetical protein TVAGG3_0486530 [Trichomonas vaginalis G3]|eukprot:XP_001316795.1 hypothetical protein [Trichomonas vaginalis G3]
MNPVNESANPVEEEKPKETTPQPQQNQNQNETQKTQIKNKLWTPSDFEAIHQMLSKYSK